MKFALRIELALLVIFSATRAWANQPPSTPVITEPSTDGKIVNAEDVHMETAPFSDPDPGDTHVCTDWEIWTVSPNQRVWSALCIGGVEKVHVHLGDGVFEGAYAGRSSLIPQTSYFLRARHKDSSGDPGTQWSDYSIRYFSSAPQTTLFPLELDDVSSTPIPTWLDTLGHPEILAGGGDPPSLRLEAPDGQLLIELRGLDGVINQITNPAALAAHVPPRIHLNAGTTGQNLALPETNLTITDDEGEDRVIYLPAVNLAPGTHAYYWIASSGATYLSSAGETEPDFSTLARSAPVPWKVYFPGYRVEVAASGFQLPVNIAFITNPGPQSDAPLYYVTELYGQIKVVNRDGTIGTYASGLLNFNPTGEFPGSGEQGLTGIAVDPATGDVIAVMLYDSAPPNGTHYPKVDRFHSTDGGHSAATRTTILNMVGETQGQSHQISNTTIGPDGKLYVHMGDGFDTATAQNLNSFRGKILRMNLDGSPCTDNPFYNAGNGINSADYVFAYGVRNPFGGAWRALDGLHYEVENGPSVDRFAQIVRGRNYLWNGTDASMSNFAIYNWSPAHAPVNIAFIQQSTFGASGFPADKLDHAFVTESGPTYGTGPQSLGKRITEFVLNPAGGLISGPTPFIDYIGAGKATCVGLTAGPDGLYFTDLYMDTGYTSPIDAGANVLRIRYVGSAAFSADVTSGPTPLLVHFTDSSTVPGAYDWSWSFGDGATSAQQNPTHTYAVDGIYDVRLSVTGPGGVAVTQKNAFIRAGAVTRIAVISGTDPPTTTDQAIIDHLLTQGYDLTSYDDDPANRPDAATLAANYDLVIVSSSVTSGNIDAEFRTAPVPLIFWEQALLRPNREALCASGAAVAGITAINVIDVGHPITHGLTLGVMAVFSAPTSMSVGNGTRAAAAQLLATRNGAAGDYALMAAESGATLLNGYVTPARRVFLFFEDTSFLNATSAALLLLDRAVCWAAAVGPPGVTSQPTNLSVNAGAAAVFSVTVNSHGAPTYQWRRNGVPLTNGGRISGATGSTLTLNPTQPADAGFFDVVVSDACGDQISAAATLAVAPPACPGDVNGDHLVDLADLAAVLAQYGMTGPALAGDLDFDLDVDLTDLGFLLANYGAVCP